MAKIVSVSGGNPHARSPKATKYRPARDQPDPNGPAAPNAHAKPDPRYGKSSPLDGELRLLIQYRKDEGRLVERLVRFSRPRVGPRMMFPPPLCDVGVGAPCVFWGRG